LRTIIKDLYSKRRKTKDKMLALELEIDDLKKVLEKSKN
jgi:hypothetical protein